ncbi:MAG: hypothetical protein ABIK98_07510 [Pseudomonadota bacterium]|nr:hypothetical protein [Pseudomonadota bacterium]
MALLQNIRNERARQWSKKPLIRDVFTQISSLVNRHGLKESFLIVIENAEDYLTQTNLQLHRIREKTPFVPPLFSLVTHEEYLLAKAIISKVDNPYLRYAHSPEEIFQSKLLYRLNPKLAPETLIRNHFETLLLYAYSQNKVGELVKKARAIEKTLVNNYETEMFDTIQSKLIALQERITKLQNFIAKLETVIA